MDAKLKMFISDITLSVPMVFDHLFPKKWAKDTIIPEINRQLITELNYCYFIMLIGMCFIM